MNLQAEANRLAGCRDMDMEAYRLELLMALEGAYKHGLRDGLSAQTDYEVLEDEDLD